MNEYALERIEAGKKIDRKHMDKFHTFHTEV